MAMILSKAYQNPFSASLRFIIGQHWNSPRSIAEMNEELTALIVKELAKHHDRKEIIRKVCEQGGLYWKDAERLIVLVEAKHKRMIGTRQAPFLLFLSIGTLLLGIGLVAFNMQILLVFFQKDVLGQVLSLQSSYYQIIGLCTGLGMTAGGLVGLWKAFGTVFPD
jgi:hypothetical protein